MNGPSAAPFLDMGRDVRRSTDLLRDGQLDWEVKAFEATAVIDWFAGSTPALATGRPGVRVLVRMDNHEVLCALGPKQTFSQNTELVQWVHNLLPTSWSPYSTWEVDRGRVVGYTMQSMGQTSDPDSLLKHFVLEYPGKPRWHSTWKNIGGVPIFLMGPIPDNTAQNRSEPAAVDVLGRMYEAAWKPPAELTKADVQWQNRFMSLLQHWENDGKPLADLGLYRSFCGFVQSLPVPGSKGNPNLQKILLGRNLLFGRAGEAIKAAYWTLVDP